MEGHDDVEEGEISFRRSRMFSKFFYVWALHVLSNPMISVDSVVQWFLVISAICRAVFFLSAAKELFIDRMFRAEVQLLFLGLS